MVALTFITSFLTVGTAVRAAVPPPQRLLPDSTLIMVTVPDCARMGAIWKRTPDVQWWRDPSMRAFKEHFLSKCHQNLIEPLNRELGVDLGDYARLVRGQLTFALANEGEPGDETPALGLILLLDAKDKAGALKSDLEALRRKWVDSGKPIRTENIRGFEFSVINTSDTAVPETLRGFLPHSLQYRELGKKKARTASAQDRLFIGQVDSLLVVADSMKLAQRVVAQLNGGQMPCLADNPAFNSDYQRLFRNSPLYGWVNTKACLDLVRAQLSRQPEGSQAANPLLDVKPEQVLRATGLNGLKTAAFALQTSQEGTTFEFFLGVPESERAGLFKILAGEPKGANVPAFVPATAVKFERWRIDGQKAWKTFVSMLAGISPEYPKGINFMLDAANMAGRQKDPDFDVRRTLIGNLGDDIITYEKAPASPGDTASAPSLFLLGSPAPEQLAAALKSVLAFVAVQSGPAAERDFLGHTIYSVPLPSVPLPMAGAGAAPTTTPKAPRTLSYAASGGYVAFSTDAATLEEFLRSGEGQGTALRDVSGLVEAAQKVRGPDTSLFGYQNQAEAMRVLFDGLKQNPSRSAGLSSLNLLWGHLPGMTPPKHSVKDWCDFSLLPSFDQVAKYFYFSVYGGSAGMDGLSLKVYAPTPPALR